jgi:hypothetical protein
VPNPQISVISTLFWKDGSTGQHAEEFRQGGRTYVVAVDEGGSGSFQADPSAANVVAGAAGVYGRGPIWPIACDGYAPFAYARIVDVTDPRVPTVISKLRTEVQDPANCPKIINDDPPGHLFGYNAHYCSVDNPENATAIACGYFEQGVRVFGIGDPNNPKEIAYYNPPANPGNSDFAHKGSHAGFREPQGPTADWASSWSRFYHRESDDTWELWIQTQQNGAQILRFTNGVYPLP